jgi:hypothetical protein
MESYAGVLTVKDTLVTLDGGTAAALKTAGVDTVIATVAVGADITATVVTGIDALILTSGQNYSMTAAQAAIAQIGAGGTPGTITDGGTMTIVDTLANVDAGAATTLKTAGADIVAATVAVGADITATVVTGIDSIILTNDQNYTVTAAQAALVVDADGTGMESYAGVLTVKDTLVTLDGGTAAALKTAGVDTVIATVAAGADITALNATGVDSIILTNDQNYTVTAAQAAIAQIGAGGTTGTITGAGSITVTASDSDDTFSVLTTGTNIITGGLGNDNITAGNGNDTFILVGTTAAGQYSGSDTQFSDLTSINGRTTSDVQAGESYDGGLGTNTLHIYGTVDMTGVTILNFDNVIVHSDVTFTESQLAAAGVTAITGDGGSTVRFADDGAADVNLSGITLTDIGQLDVGDDVKAITSQANIAAIGAVSSGFTNAVLANSVATVDLDLSGKTVFGGASVQQGNGTVTVADISSAAGATNIELIIDGINSMIGATNGSDIGSINQALVSIGATPQALVVLNDYELSVGNLAADTVIQGRAGVQNFIAGGLGSDTLIGADGASNFIYGGAEVTTNATDENTIIGGNNRDFIAGGNEKDTISGGDGDDFISGGSGDDIISGGAGTDFIHAGEGSDTITVDNGADYIDLGETTKVLDTVKFSEKTTSTSFILNFDISGTGTDDNLAFLESEFISGNAGAKSVLGSGTSGVKFDLDTADFMGVVAIVDVAAANFSNAGAEIAAAITNTAVDDAFVFLISDGSNTLVLGWDDRVASGGNSNGLMDANETTQIAMLVGVTSVFTIDAGNISILA